jgi:hypothetical protein
MLNTCMPHYKLYKLQEQLVKKNNEKITILIVDDDVDILRVMNRA